MVLNGLGNKSWNYNPDLRPSFNQIFAILEYLRDIIQDMYLEICAYYEIMI